MSQVHIGRTGGLDCQRPVLTVDGRAEGAMSSDGMVMGSYVHGIFADDEFRRAFLSDLAASKGQAGHFAEVDFEARVDSVLNQLAGEMAQHLDLDGFTKIARL